MKAIFLDKDGTLIKDVPYNVRPELIRLLPGVGEGLRRLHAAGYALIIVSNQSGVARGYFPEAALQGVERKMQALFEENGVPLLSFRYCPHYPEGSAADYVRDCACRKPQPGLLLQAAQDYGLDLGQCWMIGDILNDVEAGHRAGCRSILINNGNETEWVMSPLRQPDFTARSFEEAAQYIAGDLS